jgi:hypothetical protein
METKSLEIVSSDVEREIRFDDFVGHRLTVKLSNGAVFSQWFSGSVNLVEFDYYAQRFLKVQSRL